MAPSRREMRALALLSLVCTPYVHVQAAPGTPVSAAKRQLMCTTDAECGGGTCDTISFMCDYTGGAGAPASSPSGSGGGGGTCTTDMDCGGALGSCDMASWTCAGSAPAPAPSPSGGGGSCTTDADCGGAVGSCDMASWTCASAASSPAASPGGTGTGCATDAECSGGSCDLTTFQCTSSAPDNALLGATHDAATDTWHQQTGICDSFSACQPTPDFNGACNGQLMALDPPRGRECFAKKCSCSGNSIALLHESDGKCSDVTAVGVCFMEYPLAELSGFTPTTTTPVSNDGSDGDGNGNAGDNSDSDSGSSTVQPPASSPSPSGPSCSTDMDCGVSAPFGACDMTTWTCNNGGADAPAGPGTTVAPVDGNTGITGNTGNEHPADGNTGNTDSGDNTQQHDEFTTAPTGHDHDGGHQDHQQQHGQGNTVNNDANFGFWYNENLKPKKIDVMIQV